MPSRTPEANTGLFAGSGDSDFGPQLKNFNKELFTLVAWDPRGYGHSRPPQRDFPVDFFERDARDAVDLMKVGLGEVTRGWEGDRGFVCFASFLLSFFFYKGNIL